MEYIKIRADFKYAEKGRLYRVFLVPKGMGLFELGCHIVSAFRGTLEHCFLYVHNKTEFVPAAFMEDSFPGIKSLWMGLYDVEDLPGTFEFHYDTGDGWDFCCKKYKRTVNANYKGNPRIIVLEGAGQGIWEDNIGTLYNYFCGLLDPDAEAIEYEDDEHAFYLPWNVTIEKWGDFDAPLDKSTFLSLEDKRWKEAWKEEYRYAKKLKLNQEPKDNETFDLRAIARDVDANMVAYYLAEYFDRKEVSEKAEATYGRRLGHDLYVKAFRDELERFFNEEALDAFFKNIEKRIAKSGAPKKTKASA